jgi:hypothetical protein
MAIAYVRGVAANITSAASNVTSGTFTATAGQDIFVAVAIADTTKSVSSISDTAGNTYTLKSSVSNAGNVRVELWQAHGITANASNAVSVTLSGSALASIAVAEYSGIGTQGTSNISNSTATGFFPRTLTAIQYLGGCGIAALGFVSNSGDTIVVDVGSLRQSSVPTVTSVGIALVDVSSSGNCTVTNDAKLNNSRAWAAAGFEIGTGVTTVVSYTTDPIVESPFMTQFTVNGANGFAFPYSDLTGGSNG